MHAIALPNPGPTLLERISKIALKLLVGPLLMALTLETNARNALGDALDDLINTGTGTSNLKFETSGDVEVATIDFQNPAFGAWSTGVGTLQGVPLTDASATGGTIAQFSIYNRAGTKVLEGTVTAGGGGGDIEITSLSVTATESVELTSLTITVPAS